MATSPPMPWLPALLLALVMCGCTGNNPGDESPDDGLPCDEPTFTSADPCCSVITTVPEAAQCTNQGAYDAVCTEDDFCCLEEWEACCVSMYVEDHGANCL